jgi:hypothetical protein
MQAFIPGASPPDVRTPILLIFLFIPIGLAIVFQQAKSLKINCFSRQKYIFTAEKVREDKVL